MSSERYDVVFRGKLVADANAGDVRAKLAKLFKIDLARVEKLMGGQRVVIKRAVEEATAHKYRDAIRAAGAVCAVVSARTESNGSAPLAQAVASKTKKQPVKVATPPKPDPAPPPIQFGSSKPAEPVAASEPPKPDAAPPPIQFGSSEPSEVDAAPVDDARSAEKPDTVQFKPTAVPDPTEDSILAAPGAQLAKRDDVQPPEVSLDHLHLVEVGALLGDANRAEAPDIDTSGLAMDEVGTQITERKSVAAPTFNLDALAVDEVGAVFAKPPNVKPPEIDISALSTADPESAFEQPPKPDAPEFDLSDLSLTAE